MICCVTTKHLDVTIIYKLIRNHRFQSNLFKNNIYLHGCGTRAGFISICYMHGFSDRIRVRTKALLIRIWADPWDPDPHSMVYILIRICTRKSPATFVLKTKKYIDDLFEYGNIVKKIKRCPSLNTLNSKMNNLMPDLLRNVTDPQYLCKHD